MLSHARQVSKLAAVASLIAFAPAAHAKDWVVAVHVHEVEALTNSDEIAPFASQSQAQDMYRKVTIEAVTGTGATAQCDNEDDIDGNKNHVTPGDWGCTMTVSGGPNTLVRVKLEIWDDDDLSGDDELDVNSDGAQLGIDMRYEPATSKLTILGVPAFASAACAPGKVELSGFGPGSGDEPAEVTFSVTSSGVTAIDGDSDGDGLFDTWEVCGVNADDDAQIEVDLKAMGADPFRKDVFVELDWMTDTNHSHEPWLPALISAWAEMDQVPVSNPPNDAGVASRGGIALHVDTGILFANYALNIDGAGGADFSVGSSGGLDLVMDSMNQNVTIGTSTIPDIGNLGGGNRVPEVATLLSAPGPTQQIFAPGSTFAGIKASAFDSARSDVFHYALFSHTFQGAGTAIGFGETRRKIDDRAEDFTVSMAPIMTNPNFNGIQRVDANRDGVNDIIGQELFGSAGVRVHGTIAQQVQTFIHELGHNLSLLHGPFNIDGNPNFLSIMSVQHFPGVAYDLVGNDAVADALGLDWDADKISDVRRFHYSREILPVVNESALDETAPIGPAPLPIIIGWSCPPGAPPPAIRPGRADRPPNWDCDGTPGETGGAVGNNNVNNFRAVATPANEMLLGHDDYARIQSLNGLDFTSEQPDHQLSDVEYAKRNAQRILEPTGREWFQQRCPRPHRISFEEFSDGTAVSGQYAPAVQLLADAVRAPTIVGPGGRNNVPTSSTGQSLLNRPRVDVASPLSMTFGEPQRVVRFSYGQAGLTNSPRDRTTAVLRAWDQNDLPMGILVRRLPPASSGVTEPMTIVSVYPDELIRRVELSFETTVATGAAAIPVPIAEPVLIDDLNVCERLDETGLKPFLPPQPKFGERSIALKIASEAVHQTSTLDASGKPQLLRAAFTGLPVTLNGAAGSKTDSTITHPEGTVVKVAAPATFSGWKFLYWRHSSGVSFGNGNTVVPVTLLKDGELTAVYEGRRPERPAEPVDEDQAREDCFQVCVRLHPLGEKLPPAPPQPPNPAPKELNSSVRSGSRS
jgi:hypothetical protein